MRIGLSHRIAGPIYRLQRTLTAAKEGDYTSRAKLREHDYLGEVATSLNEFMDVLDRREQEAAGRGTKEPALLDPQGHATEPSGAETKTAGTTDDSEHR